MLADVRLLWSSMIGILYLQINKRLVRDKGMEDRIRNEVEIHSQLTHSAILKVSIIIMSLTNYPLLPIPPLPSLPHYPSPILPCFVSPLFISYMMSLKMINISTWCWSYARREISTITLELKRSLLKVMVSNSVAFLV